LPLSATHPRCDDRRALLVRRDWRAPGCLGNRRVVEDTLVTVWRLAAELQRKTKQT
jgi:hypothetical protein